MSSVETTEIPAEAVSPFQAKVKALMDSAGGLNALARRLGISAGGISYWTKTDGSRPHRSTLVRLLPEFGVSVDWLLDDSQPLENFYRHVTEDTPRYGGKSEKTELNNSGEIGAKGGAMNLSQVPLDPSTLAVILEELSISDLARAIERLQEADIPADKRNGATKALSDLMGQRATKPPANRRN